MSRADFDKAGEAYDAWEHACELAGRAAAEAQEKIDAYAVLAERAAQAKRAYLDAIAGVPGMEHSRPSIPAHLRVGPS